jgi:hypothetical protein
MESGKKRPKRLCERRMKAVALFETELRGDALIDGFRLISGRAS